MAKPKVTLGILLFKEIKYLTQNMLSILGQSYENLEVIFRDQSPNGEVYEYIKANHPDYFDKATIVKADNVMHSGGHNAIIRGMLQTGGEFYICASNDMLYPPDFVSKMMEAMEKTGAKVATCKLMQWNFERAINGDLSGSKTSKIDSLGIGIARSHYFYDIGQGMEESEVKFQKLLGPSGALAMFHRDALEAVAFKNQHGMVEYFDELLHYKNDVDLSYRLSWAGFPCLLVDNVKVYHDRQLGDKGTGVLSKVKDHHQKAMWAKASSFKGHLITIRKNFDPDFSFIVKLKTFLSSLVRFFYTLFLAPKMLSVYRDVRKLRPEIEAKRQAIQKNVSAKEIEALMS